VCCTAVSSRHAQPGHTAHHILADTPQSGLQQDGRGNLLITTVLRPGTRNHGETGTSVPPVRIASPQVNDHAHHGTPVPCKTVGSIAGRCPPRPCLGDGSERGSSPRPGRRRGPGRGLAGSGLVHRAQNPRPSPTLGSRTGMAAAAPEAELTGVHAGERPLDVGSPNPDSWSATVSAAPSALPGLDAAPASLSGGEATAGPGQ
jgi:hypothetical protein